MRMQFRHPLALLSLATGLLAAAPPGSAHIVLSQTRFEAGQSFAAFFKVEHGCDDSPTIFLRVQLPPGVELLRAPDKEFWTVRTEREGNRVTAVTWRGKLPSKSADQFGMFVKLPAKPGALYFPIVQQCEKGEARWTDIPAAGKTLRDVPRPAAYLEVVAPVPPTQYMVGDIMLLGLWSPATPGGAATAAAYMTIMNHGDKPDTLLGGTSPVAARLEIHRTAMTNGVSSMRVAAEGMPIAAGQSIALEPLGSFHVMMTGLKAPLVPGSRVPVTLNFAKAGAIPVELVVAAIGARGAPQGSAMTGMDHR